MNHDDVAFIDSIVTEFRTQLLKVGYLSRINYKQRDGLHFAHKAVLDLPALAREKAKVDAEKQLDAGCQAMSDLTKSERA